MISQHLLSSDTKTPVAKCHPKIYTVGTLTYTLRDLTILFAWLLGGDFVFCFFENIFGRFLPLYMNDLQASNTLIGSLSSIAGGINLVFGPSISQWSDRCRTPWGRRIPFLAMAAPLTVVSLILIGFTPEIGQWVHRNFFYRVAPGLSSTVVILTALSVFVAFFHYFNMVLCGAFNWLLQDVVPMEVMGRILSWFRIVSSLSAMAFNYYVFPYVLSHRKEVCMGVGFFYLIVFLMMCWKVKEGEYPPPPIQEAKRGILKSFLLYFEDCLSMPIYRNYFFAIMLNGFGGCAGTFTMLFYRNNLHLSMEQMGIIFTYGLGVGAVANVPIGWLCDKINPFRVTIIALAGLFVLNAASFLFITDFRTLMISNIFVSFVSVGWGLGSSSATMRLFPSEKFAQFATAMNIFGMGIGIIGNLLVGLFMDLMGNNYRIAYAWLCLSGLATFPLIKVYREWLRYGGPDNYKAPLA